MKISPPVWLAWVAAVLILLSSTRNPIYLALVLLWVGVMWERSTRTADTPPIPFSPVRLGGVIVILSALFNAAMVHVGTTVLLRLPAGWPLVGGIITLEGLVFGALNGLALAGFLLAFSVLNQTVPVNALVRLIPRAFQPVAVVLSIAITFVPTTLRQFRHIREAQAVRGYQPRGLRDWLPLFLPLLVGGLERALNLAETMTARGFAGTDEPGRTAATRTGMVAGLGLILLGWAAQLLTGAGWALGAVGLGGALVGGALWVAGRRVPHTTYRRQVWRQQDWLALAAIAVPVALVLIPISAFGRDTLIFYPYPALIMPQFNIWMALATTGLLAPAVWLKPETGLSSLLTADK